MKTPHSMPTLMEHARQLAVAFDVRLIESPLLKPEEALALPHLRLVLTAPIHEALGYAVTLHEIGHLAAPAGCVPGVIRTASIQRIEEEAAWNWARHYALYWTEPMEELAKWCESTYQDAPQPQRPSPPAPAAPPPKTKTTERIDWEKWQRRTKS